MNICISTIKMVKDCCCFLDSAQGKKKKGGKKKKRKKKKKKGQLKTMEFVTSVSEAFSRVSHPYAEPSLRLIILWWSLLQG